MTHPLWPVAHKIAGKKECPAIKPNRYKIRNKSLVSQIKVSKNLKESILRAVNKIGGFKKVIKNGDTVLVKPNFNTLDPPPASTDLEFLLTVAKLLYQAGASQVTVGDRSGYWLGTTKELGKAGYLKVFKKEGLNFIDFDKRPWYLFNLNSSIMRDAVFSSEIFNHDKIVYLPCLKTHFQARFTLSLKLTVGFMHPGDRKSNLHLGNLEAKCAEINKVVHPDLIIMDGRKCFVTEGPFNGELRYPNLILASGDRIALDVRALKILLSYPADNLLIYKNPFQYQQIKRAVELGLGARLEKEIKVVEYNENHKFS